MFDLTFGTFDTHVRSLDLNINACWHDHWHTSNTRHCHYLLSIVDLSGLRV